MPETKLEEEAPGVELGKLVHHIRVSEMPRDLPAETRFVGLESIAPHEGEFLELSSTSQVRSRVFRFQSGDVLYGRLRPYLRKAAIADFDGFASGEVTVLRCSERILPRYLLTLLLSEDFTQFVNARTRGDRPRVSFASIATYRVELPSLETQEEVCARDARLGAAVSKLGTASANVVRITELIMNQMRAKLIWGSGEGSVGALADLVESIDYGTSQKSIYGGGGAPVLRIPNITSSGEIDASDLKFAVLSQRELVRSRLEAGDILLVRSNGSLALVGQAAKVSSEHEGYSFAGYLLRMRPKSSVLSDYLVQIVRSDAFKRMVEAASRSSTGINNLSAGRLAKFVVPIVEIEQQRQVVDILSRLQASVTSSSTEVKQTWAYAKELHESARRGWLGHPTLPEHGRSIEESRTMVVRDQRKTEGPRMQRDIQSMMFEKIDATPDGEVSFEAIFDGLRVDYDSARDVLFKLLAAQPPALTQVFDRKSRSIVLRRSK
jgi:type I restriction enzyme S subunit